MHHGGASVFCSSFPLLSDLELETLVRLVSLQTLVVLRKVVPEVGFPGLCFDLSSPEPDCCAPCCLVNTSRWAVTTDTEALSSATRHTMCSMACGFLKTSCRLGLFREFSDK